MTMLFESDNLDSSTPAMVSRLGIIYMEPFYNENEHIIW